MADDKKKETKKERFRKTFLLLDSSVEGEREAALHQVRALLAKDKRTFRDLLDAVDNTAPLEQYRALEAELEKLRAANQGLEQQNGAYAKAAKPPAPWVSWKLRAESALITTTLAAMIAAAAHHQAMTAKVAQFHARLNLAGQMLASAEQAEKQKWKNAAGYRAALKCVIGEDRFCPPGAHSQKYLYLDVDK